MKVLLCPFSHFEFREKRQDRAAQSNTYKFAELICSPLGSFWGNPSPSPAKFPDIWSQAFSSKSSFSLAGLSWLDTLSLRSIWQLLNHSMFIVMKWAVLLTWRQSETLPRRSNNRPSHINIDVLRSACTHIACDSCISCMCAVAVLLRWIEMSHLF